MHQPKPTISFLDQLDLLKKRKLIVTDESFALDYLKRNSYYHLNLYFKKLQRRTGNYDADGFEEVEFLPGTTFEEIVRIHENDCRLRGFVMQLLQPIEIRLRTMVSYHLGLQFGSLVFYEDAPYFDKVKINKLRDQFANLVLLEGANPIVGHHKHKYQGMFPLYAILELTSFGFLRNYYFSLDWSLQNQIAKDFLQQQNALNLKTWMLCLCDLRNICAHHNYLYERLFDATPYFINSRILERGQRKTLFAYFVVMGYLSTPDFWESVLDELDDYNRKTDCLHVKSYGFGPDWKRKLIQDIVHF